MMDKEALIETANRAGISIVAETAVSHIPHRQNWRSTVVPQLVLLQLWQLDLAKRHAQWYFTTNRIVPQISPGLVPLFISQPSPGCGRRIHRCGTAQRKPASALRCLKRTITSRLPNLLERIRAGRTISFLVRRHVRQPTGRCHQPQRTSDGHLPERLPWLLRLRWI